MEKIKISMGADHAGYELKAKLVTHLQTLGYDVLDHGPHNADRVDYPDYAKLVADDVQTKRSQRGVLVCGSGIGMAISANKFKGIRAASIVDVYSAEMARKHNDLNVLGLGARILDFEKAKEILSVFLNTEFEGGRHAERLQKICEFEK